MKYLLITPNYPSNDNLYNSAFIHSRVKLYKQNNMEIIVFCINKNAKLNTYEFDGVKVTVGNKNDLIYLMKNNEFHKILIHFVNFKFIDAILDNRKNSKIIIWVHGYEALGWYRRLFLLNFKNIFSFLKYIFINIIQLNMMRNLINKYQENIKFIFVSNWMKNILEKDTFSKGKIKNYEIIPNVIDEGIFKYNAKESNLRYNILSIRPYNSKKYANDISVKAILELAKDSDFEKYNISFYGKGKLFNRTVKYLRKYKNIHIYEKFLTQEEMVEKYNKNGIFLAPTRQDSQGVSMCEAMSCGLVPITSYNTAIPEFVDYDSGFLTKNYKEIAEAIRMLDRDSNLFMSMSMNASQKILSKCSKNKIITNELRIIKE